MSLEDSSASVSQMGKWWWTCPPTRPGTMMDSRHRVGELMMKIVLTYFPASYSTRHHRILDIEQAGRNTLLTPSTSQWPFFLRAEHATIRCQSDQKGFALASRRASKLVGHDVYPRRSVMSPLCRRIGATPLRVTRRGPEDPAGVTKTKSQKMVKWMWFKINVSLFKGLPLVLPKSTWVHINHNLHLIVGCT